MRTRIIVLMGLAALLVLGQQALASEPKPMKQMDKSAEMNESASMKKNADSMDKTDQKMDSGNSMEKKM